MNRQYFQTTPDWDRPVLWAFLVLCGLMALGGAGCGDASVPEEASTRVQALSGGDGETCVTFQRGTRGTVADAKISSRQPGKNFGGEPVASISGSNGQVEQVLLRFDTSAIPAEATLSSATLTVWQTNSGRPTSLKAHAVTGPWAESSVTWNSFGSAHELATAASVEAPAHEAPRTLDVSGLVAGWVHTPSGNHGLLLEQSEGKTLMDTSESPHPERRPRLEICYTLDSGTLPSGTSVLLQVVDSAGNPIPDAVITTWETIFSTDSVGRLLLEELEPGRFAAKVQAQGYTSATAVLELRAGAHVGYEVALLPLGEPLLFQVETGATLEKGGVRVTIPPGSVVDALGRPVTGQVEATIVPLDPTTQLDFAPGPLEGLRADGSRELALLQSLFMAEVSLWSHGAPLQLAPGARATLEFELPEAVSSRFQAGASVPAWWFDLDAGLWREEGSGTLQPSQTHPGRLMWTVQVSHFTTWNCDDDYDSSCVRLRVIGTQGARGIPNVEVNAKGVNYSGRSPTRYTDEDGNVDIDIMYGGIANVYLGPHYGSSGSVATVTGTTQGRCNGGTGVPYPTPLRIQSICTPGEYRECPYTGPAGTQGQGRCRAGRRQCNVFGMQWSACQGEVLPAPEACRLPFDEDCDGQVNESCSCSELQGTGCYTGPVGTQDVGQCHGGTVSCDVFGQVACVGQHLPQLEQYTVPGDENCNGADEYEPGRWLLTLKGEACTEPRDIAVDTAGNVLVAGTSGGSINLGGGPLPLREFDLFVTKRDANGQHVFSKHIQRDSAVPYTYGWNYDTLATDSQGNVLVAGEFGGNLRLDGTQLTSEGLKSLFVAKLSPSGQVLWNQSFSGNALSWASAEGLSVDSAGNVIVAGSFFGTLRFGLKEHSWQEMTAGAVYVAKLDANTGTPLWSQSFQVLGEPRLSESLTFSSMGEADLTVNGADEVLMDTGFAGTAIHEGNPLVSGAGHLLVKLTSDGGIIWAKAIPMVSYFGEYYPRLRLDGTGNAWLLSYTFSPPEGYPYLLVLRRLDDTGEVSEEKAFAAATEFGYVYAPPDLALDSAGRAVVAGSFWGTMDFGGGPRSSFPGNDDTVSPFVAWYSGSAIDYVTDRTYPATFSNGVWGMAASSGIEADGAGNVLLMGAFAGTFDFGHGTAPVRSGCNSTFVLKSAAP